MQFVFEIKSVKIEIFSLEDTRMFNLIKTIFFLIFLIFFFLKLRFLRLLLFVLFFVAFLIFDFFFIVFLLNLFLKDTIFLFLLLLDSCLKTKSLKKIVNFVDLSIAILFLFLTKILYLLLIY